MINSLKMVITTLLIASSLESSSTFFLNSYEVANGALATIPMASNVYEAACEYALKCVPSYRTKVIEELIKTGGASDSVPLELQQRIQSIFQECGIKNPQEIRILEYNNQNFLAGLRGGCILFVNSARLLTYSQKEQRHIIGHEAMHIKHNDVRKELLFLAALPFIIHGSIHLCNKALSHAVKHSTKAPSILTFFTFATQLITTSALTKWLLAEFLQARLLRSVEMKADIDAVQTLSTGEQALSMLKSDLPLHNQESNPFSSHPTIAERIAYLEKIRAT